MPVCRPRPPTLFSLAPASPADYSQQHVPSGQIPKTITRPGTLDGIPESTPNMEFHRIKLLAEMQIAITALVTISVGLMACSDRNVGASSGVRDSLLRTKELLIHEGLPHQAFEPGALGTERLREDVEDIAGYPFYLPAVEVGEDEKNSLKLLLSSKKSISSFSGEKPCGGFHPDFAVSWTTAMNESFAALICFGCDEILFVSPSTRIRYDLSSSSISELKEVLARFKLKRPADHATSG